jgi:hypothetical protein
LILQDNHYFYFYAIQMRHPVSIMVQEIILLPGTMTGAQTSREVNRSVNRNGYISLILGSGGGHKFTFTNNKMI